MGAGLLRKKSPEMEKRRMETWNFPKNHYIVSPERSQYGVFIKIASENPVLWTGMKDVSAEGKKKQTRC
jgi:hypothetical protein